MTKTDKVAQNAATYRQLLESIRALDHAPPTLAQIQQQLETSQGELKNEQETLASLEASTLKEFQDWDDIQHRASKRIWTCIFHPKSGDARLSAREDQEEQEYLDALAAEEGSRARIAVLEGQVAELEGQVGELEGAAAEHARLNAQVEELYASVFDGPNPGYAEEDAAEREYAAAQGRYNDGTIANEQRALGILREALVCLANAGNACVSALQISAQDVMRGNMMRGNMMRGGYRGGMMRGGMRPPMQMGGGNMLDMMERSQLANAQRMADQARMMVMQAQTLQPAIGGFGSVIMPQGNLMSDVFFDNRMGNHMFHQKIRAAEKDLRSAHDQLKNVVQQSQNRLDGLVTEGEQRSAALEDARTRLEETRREIMERVAG